jgi:glycerophosphoryl diester phosphodiesterase
MAAIAADIPIAWMSNSPAATYSSKGYAWANLSTEYVYRDGQTGVRSIMEFSKAGIQFSVYNADTDADMQYYISNAALLKAICTNYPAKLLGKMDQIP